MNSREQIILLKIIQYAEQIALTIAQRELTGDKLSADFIAKNAVAMCVLQIGELVGHLSAEFKAQHRSIPWQQIKDMRNVAAHNYGEFDLTLLWETITADVPELKKYCDGIVNPPSDH